MIWGQLLDRTLLGFPTDERGELENPVKGYLIEAQEDFVVYTRCLEKEYTTSLSASTESVTLPDDFIEMSGRVEFKGRLLRPMNEWKLASLKKTDDSWDMGTPQRYFIHGDTLYLVPGASAAGTLAMWYAYRPVVDDASSMSNLTFDWDTGASPIKNKSPDIPDIYHPYLVDYARAMVFFDRGDNARGNDVYNKYVMNRTRMKGLHGNRTITGPQFVADVM